MKVTCVMCPATAEVDRPPENGKFLCQNCFEKVKNHFERNHPGKTLGLKTEDSQDQDNIIKLQACKIRCPRCGSIWMTNLEVEWCNCLNCGQKLTPKKHVVVNSENEVN